MLTTIAVVLVVLWLVGFVAFPIVGGFVHFLLIVAIILVLIRIIKGQNPFK